MKRRAYLILLLTLFLGTYVHAQGLPVQSSDIDLSINPAVPGPSQTARAVLDSSVTDLSQAQITWRVNGAIQAQGKGLTSFDFAMGALGTQTTISAGITSSDGIFTKSVTLDSGSVDLLSQGSDYIPPFYEGRKLWGRQTLLTLYAIPHVFNSKGQQISPSNLIFRWSKDGTIIGDSSGVGADTFSVADTILGMPVNIKVDVMIDRDTVSASAQTQFAPKAPELYVYEDNPLYGYKFNNEVGKNFSLTDKEVTFAAFPFFFGAQSRLSTNILYGWNTNGGDTQTGSEVTYRAPDGEGQSSVNASAKSLTQILQDEEKDFTVQFNTSNAF